MHMHLTYLMVLSNFVETCVHTHIVYFAKILPIPFSHIHANRFFNYNRLHNATWKPLSIKVNAFLVQQNTPKHNSLIGSFCYGKDIHEEMQRLWPSNFKLSQLDQDTLSFSYQSLYHSLRSFFSLFYLINDFFDALPNRFNWKIFIRFTGYSNRFDLFHMLLL